MLKIGQLLYLPHFFAFDKKTIPMKFGLVTTKIDLQSKASIHTKLFTSFSIQHKIRRLSKKRLKMQVSLRKMQVPLKAKSKYKNASTDLQGLICKYGKCMYKSFEMCNGQETRDKRH